MHVPQEIYVLYLFMAKCHMYIRKEYFVMWPTTTAAWATIHSELVRQARLSPETTAENRRRGKSCCVSGHAFPSSFLEGVPSCTLGGAGLLRLAFQDKNVENHRCRQIFHDISPACVLQNRNPWLLRRCSYGFTLLSPGVS